MRTGPERTGLHDSGPGPARTDSQRRTCPTHPTRPIPLLRRALGLVAVPALLLTAACSDGDDGGDDAASFCDRFRELDERYSGLDDPTDEDFTDAISELAALAPRARPSPSGSGTTTCTGGRAGCAT